MADAAAPAGLSYTIKLRKGVKFHTLCSYNDKVAEYAYDPPKAKELLAKAGHANDAEVEFWYLPVTRPVQRANGVIRQADRAVLHEKAQLSVKEEAPWITIAHSSIRPTSDSDGGNAADDGVRKLRRGSNKIRTNYKAIRHLHHPAPRGKP